MDKTNNRRNIITFSKTFLSCYTKAEEYYQKGAYGDALQEANNAYSIEYNADVLLLLAEIYMEKGCYDLVLICACKVLALGKLDSIKRERLFLLIPRVLIELGQNYASVFYILRNSTEIADVLSKILPPDQNLEAMLDKEMKALLEGGQDEDEETLVFADRKREQYNEETMTRAMKLINDGELTDAKYLLMSLYDTGSKTYKESQRFLSYLYATENNLDKAVETLYAEFKKDKRDSEWIYAVDNMGKQYKPLAKQMLEEFVPSEQKDSMYEAIRISCWNEYDELAYKFASELSSRYPNDIKCSILKIFAKWNFENSIETKNELLKLLYTARAYYPAKYIARLRFPKRFDLNFDDLPFELIPKLSRNVLKAVYDYKDGEDYVDLLTAVIFLVRNVCNDEYSLSDRMIYAIEVIGGQFQLDLYKQITASPKVHMETQKYAIEQLVHRFRKGTFFYNNEGFIMEITLRVPPSYDDFSPKLKEEYQKAFSMMAEFDNTFEKQLSEIFEKAYLKDLIYEFPKSSVFSFIVGYYLVMKKSPDSVIEFCKNAGINNATYKKHATKLQELLNHE